MKYRFFSLLILMFAASIGIAAAQSANSRSSSLGTSSLGKSSLDKSSSVTSAGTGQSEGKPLTPKSAMPAQRKPSAAMPNNNSSAKANAELAGLERTRVEAPKTQKGSVAKANSVAPKSRPTANSGINFKYQKPAGGMRASNPGANSKSSSIRVQHH